MADAFSYFLPDGTPVNGSTNAPPAGTAAYQSAALVPDANGQLTKADQGDALNAFRGFVSADGGKFGGFQGTSAPSEMDKWNQQVQDLGLVQQANGQWLQTGSAADRAREARINMAMSGGPERAVDGDGNVYEGGMGGRKIGHINDAAYGPVESATPTPNKVTPVPNQTDPFASFQNQLDTAPAEGATLLPNGVQSVPNQPQVVEGFRQFNGVQSVPNQPMNSQGAAPSFSQGAWSGGSMAPSNGSAARPSLMGGRFGRFQAMGGSPIANKMRQRFKPLGAPANGLNPQGAAPTTNVF